MTTPLSRETRIRQYIASVNSLVPCGTCYENCDENCIKCKICLKSYHRKCSKLTQNVFNHKKESNTFICSSNCLNSGLPFHGGDDIDFFSALLGDGTYPCKKCHRDCLDMMNCISCSACGLWLHASCTKLSKDKFETIAFFFCSKKCERNVILPGTSARNQGSKNDDETDSDENVEEKSKKKDNRTVFDDVFDHFLDVKCSYVEPNDLVETYLAKDRSELVIFHNNVRSLNGNFETISDIFQNCNKKLPDILAVSETRLSSESTIPQIPGYVFEGVNATITQNHMGGVGMYLSDRIDYSIRDDLSLNHRGSEDLWINLKLQNNLSCSSKKSAYENFVVGIIYRHDQFSNRSQFTETFCKSLKTLQDKKTNYIIVGDFNIDTCKYNVVTNVTNHVNSVFSSGCNMFINEPTRVTDRTSTCISHVYSNLPASDLDNHVVRSDVSDHYSTLTKISGIVKTNKKQDIYRRRSNLSPSEWNDFNEELGTILNEKLSTNSTDIDANFQANCISNTFKLLLDKYMPLKKLSRKERRYFYKPWITPAIKVSINTKNKLFKKSKRKKDPKYRNEYKVYRNILSRTKRRAFENYYRDKVVSFGNNRAKTWKLINEISKRKRKNKAPIKCIRGEKGKTFDSPSSISKHLNKHFSSVGKDMASDFDDIDPTQIRDALEYLNDEVSQTVQLSHTTIMEIIKFIQKLEEGKSCGYDQISNRVLKACCVIIAPFLVNLFNKCIDTGVFPDCFKVAKVTPLLKGGDKSDPNSYRPISLLPSLGKLFERVISVRVLNHFNDLNLFSEHQFGFREGFNTEFAILDLYEKFLHNLDQGRITCAVFLDLAKAFDSVSHDILLRKLKKYGIRYNAYQLFKSYLEKRSQFVTIENISSSLEFIEFRVPQGSILGPLLFLIFINDLPNATRFFIKLYADDTVLCFDDDNFKTLISNVNSELENIYKWLAANKLTLNIKKSKYMIISKRKFPMEYLGIMFNGKELKSCESYKYLGVYFDKDLNWKTHIQYITQKISKACGSIAKIRKCVDINTLREVYHALIHSYLRYGIIAWGSAAKTALQPLQVAVNRAIRIMCSAPLGRIDVDPLFEILSILKNDDLYALEVAKFMFKSKNNLLPVNIANYFQTRPTPVPRYNLRNRRINPLPLVIHRTVTGGKSINMRGNELWNYIPEHVKQSDSPNAFKTKLKVWMLSQNIS